MGLVTAQATLYDYYTKTEEGQDVAAAVRRAIKDPPVDNCTEHLGRPVVLPSTDKPSGSDKA